MLIEDLSDADVLVRPVDKANTIAWQIGHLIVKANEGWSRGPVRCAVSRIAGWLRREARDGEDRGRPVEGLRDQARNTSISSTKTRAATIGAVEKMSDADLDKPTSGNMAKWAPTVGHLLGLVGNHTLMHAGQFSVLRRKLGKPHVM